MNLLELSLLSAFSGPCTRTHNLQQGNLGVTLDLCSALQHYCWRTGSSRGAASHFRLPMLLEGDEVLAFWSISLMVFWQVPGGAGRFSGHCLCLD